MTEIINKVKNGLRAVLICVVIPLIISACWEDLEEISEKVGGGTTSAAIESNFTGATTVGEQGTITVGSQTVKMNYANNQANIIFPFVPINAVHGLIDDNSAATLTRKFFMSETQVTNALMARVLQWAYNNGKFSTTVGYHNGLDSTTAKHGGQQLLDLDDANIKINYSSGSFTVYSGYKNHPVVCVTWYGAIMFCNWLTEMRDGNSKNVVYSGIDTDWDHNETVETAANTGYRLPSNQEWEYSARYIGTIEPTQGNLPTEYVAQNVRGGHSTLTSGYYWTPYYYVSGAIKSSANQTESRAVAWYTGDPLMNGDKLMPVAQKIANQIGLRDMSGNAWEWCFTLDGPGRVLRGGGFYYSVDNALVGVWGSQTPDFLGYEVGFRFARTQ